jgi:two-component system response regulator WspF
MKIAIVSSFSTLVQKVSNLIETNQTFQVVWTAKNGQEAVKFCTKVIPDLIIMDLVMPIMDAVASTRIIMRSTPCAILILTNAIDSYPNMVSEVIKAGAIEVLNAPNDDVSSKNLLNKIKAVGKLIEQRSDMFHRRSRQERVNDKLNKCTNTSELNSSHSPFALFSNQINSNIDNYIKSTNYLVAIGASTGGPGAVLGVLRQLAATFPAPIIVVQHVEDQFVPGLAAWFEKQIALPIKIAEEAAQPQISTVLIAGGSKHLVLSSKQNLRYIEQTDMLYCPSVDLFFESLAEHWNGKIIAILLTGMGFDGANGLKILRDKGHITIAQNEQSCVVYGMPKAAIELKAAEYILAPEQIGLILNRLVLTK